MPLIYRALNTIKKTRVLQLPSIVTTDNEEATIRVLDEQATTDSTVTSGGNTSGGFGGFEAAGTTLSISPHIADDNYLLLNINLEVSGVPRRAQDDRRRRRSPPTSSAATSSRP